MNTSHHATHTATVGFPCLKATACNGCMGAAVTHQRTMERGTEAGGRGVTAEGEGHQCGKVEGGGCLAREA